MQREKSYVEIVTEPAVPKKYETERKDYGQLYFL